MADGYSLYQYRYIFDSKKMQKTRNLDSVACKIVVLIMN